jgi:hypothetical protein
MNVIHGVYNFKIENPDVNLENSGYSPKLKVLITISKKRSVILTLPRKAQ